jgi:NADPH:quinone reductase-like Zn-dependent oxidoreductase
MKAIEQDEYGSADVLELRDVDRPVPSDDQVLLRVRAAGCGPDVWHLMTGLPYFARVVVGLRRPKQKVPGWDVAGTVDRVGRSVTTLQEGDEVMGTANGSFAEYATAKPKTLAPKPARLSFEQAAALPISGVTALQALVDVGGVRPGQRVLVIGAAGGVGTLTVQIATAFGAEVTGVCSAAKMDLVRSLGATEVIDYEREDFTDGRQRWDLIVDNAGRRPLSDLRRALRPKGTLVIVGGDGGGPVTGGFLRGALRAPIVSLFVGQKLRGLTARQNRADLETLTALVDDGKLMPVIDRTFPLEAAPDALRYLAEGHSRGKIVIVVG